MSFSIVRNWLRLASLPFNICIFNLNIKKMKDFTTDDYSWIGTGSYKKIKFNEIIYQNEC